MRVAVLGGGISSEHEVSLRSAASVAAGLRQAGHETVEVTIDREGGWSVDGEAVSCTPGAGTARVRRRLPSAPRPRRGGRQRPGPPRGARRALRGLRRRGLRGLHGQTRLQGPARPPRHAAGGLLPRGRGGLAGHRLRLRTAGLGEAGPPRFEHRDLTRIGRGGARRRGGGRAATRSARDRRGARPGQGGRVLAARQRGAGRLAARGDRHQGARLVRLRGQVCARGAWS